MAAVHTQLTTSDLGVPSHEVAELIYKAQAADATDHELTIGQALRKYKKAVSWALLISFCLVMDGYDVSSVTRLGLMTGRDHNLVLRSAAIPTTIWFPHRWRRLCHFGQLAVRTV